MKFANIENTIVYSDDMQKSFGAETLTPEQLSLVEPYSAQSSVPSAVTMRQARLALLQGGLLTTVNAAIAAGNEEDKITWEYATEVKRDFPMVANMATALNLSEADLDNLFTLAATL